MTANLDKSLADMISSSSHPKKRRSSRRASAKSSLVGSPATQKAATAQRVQAQSQKQAKADNALHAEKIIVSNLPTDVNEAQIKELFAMQIGPTKEVTLHYDNAGRSKGIASVLFSKRGDGTRAYQQYHNRLIDGKRPMKVEIVLDPSKAQPTPTLSERVGPAPATNTSTGTTQGATRAKKGGKGRLRKKGAKRPPKTAEDLDAEMADYTGTTSTAAAS